MNPSRYERAMRHNDLRSPFELDRDATYGGTRVFAWHAKTCSRGDLREEGSRRGIAGRGDEERPRDMGLSGCVHVNMMCFTLFFPTILSL